MADWFDLGDGWQYRILNDDVMLRHQCATDKVFTAFCTDHDKVSLDPLTLSPSVVCDCGAHGYVRDGMWHPV